MADHFSEFDAFNVPPEFKPLGAWAYLGLSILFSIPIIGLVFVIVFSFSDANINRRNYARYYLLTLILALIVLAVLFFTGVLGQLLSSINKQDLPVYLQWLPVGK